MRNENGGKFNKRSYSKNADETCGYDHGAVSYTHLDVYKRPGLD